MFNEDLLLVCKALWRRKEEAKKCIDDDNEAALIGCIAMSAGEIEHDEQETERGEEIARIKEELKYFINTSEEEGVVYIPKYRIENMLK